MSARAQPLLAATPELDVAAWCNARGPLSLAALRGKVVAVYAFQMLCPACVTHGLPQAKKIAQLFANDEVQVLGLHTVFEHHAVMNQAALDAFLHEYRIDFPVGIDRPSATGPIPATMAQYRMRGTPTLLLFDRAGLLREHIFGAADDMLVGARIAALVHAPDAPACSEGACHLPGLAP